MLLLLKSSNTFQGGGMLLASPPGSAHGWPVSARDCGRFSVDFDLPDSIQNKIAACKELLKEHLLERMPLDFLGALSTHS